VWGTRRGIDDLLARLRDNDPTLSSLCLMRQRRLEIDDAKNLCAALAGNTKVHELVISSHDVTPDMVRSFADMLQLNTTIRRLALGNRSFGDDGVTALCPGIAANGSLVTLHLESRGITAVGCKELGQALAVSQTIEELFISDNDIGDSGLSHLAPSCCRIRVLAAAACSLSDSQMFGDALGRLFSITPPVLESLDLSRNGIGSNSLGYYSNYLGKLGSLRVINMSGCPLGPAGTLMFSVALPPSLTHLDLSETGAGSEGVIALARAIADGALPLLKRLVLCSCKADDNALTTLLASLGASPCQPGTVELDVGGNDAGMQTIEKVPSCLPLRALNLHRCGLGSDEISLLALQLNKVECLQEVDLSANFLESGDIVKLLDALSNEQAASKLKLLVIAANPGSKDDAVASALISLQEKRQLLNVVRGNVDGRE
jgi:Ran GTPase-activating protein (RanGAP) involved in mRNA processing and transport